MRSKAVYCYALALVGFFGLFTLLMLWHTVLAPSRQFPVALILLATVTPLLLPMRGFLAQNRKSCTWAAYLSLGYFLHGSIETYSTPDARWLTGLEVLFSLCLFFGAAYYVRFAARTA